MTKLWVKLKSNNATQVSTEGCQNVDDFLEAVKKELLFLYGDFPKGQPYLSLTNDGRTLPPDGPLPNLQNTARNPLFITVTETSIQSTCFGRECKGV